MERKAIRIDLKKLMIYVLKRAWLPIILAAIGFAGYYWYTANKLPDTYTASGTMYVYNGNPNLVNYQYTSSNDLNSAVQLLDTYMVVVRSNKVMDAVAERLAPDYPGILPEFIASTLSMGSVSQTGVLQVMCRTDNAQLSTDICNAVLDVAPAEIIRVVSAGGIEIIDYATLPKAPDGRSAMRKGMIGGLAGAVLGGGFLVLLFLLNRKVTDAKDLEENYTPPVLSSIKRTKAESKDPGSFLLNKDSPMEAMESYAKLRMNLLYTLAGKENHVVEVTSAISGEGKSTITANLAISCSMSEKKVLLIDGDLRRACQQEIFYYDKDLPGLSDVLLGEKNWQDCLLVTNWENLFILPAGHLPPNPAELLSIDRMKDLLAEVQQQFDLVLVDAPPINIVSDPLVNSANVAGSLFVVRQNFSDHRDVRKALIAAEMTGMEVLGFIFYGERLHEGSYYSRKYYKGYYNKYDYRRRTDENARKTT